MSYASREQVMKLLASKRRRQRRQLSLSFNFRRLIGLAATERAAVHRPMQHALLYKAKTPNGRTP